MWSLERGFEVIEIDLSFTTDVVETFDEREKVGLPRLIEALEATMWSNIEMKKREKRRPKHQTPIEIRGKEEKQEKKEEKKGEGGEKGLQSYEEVNGPVGDGPVIDNDGLAVQTTGASFNSTNSGYSGNDSVFQVLSKAEEEKDRGEGKDKQGEQEHLEFEDDVDVMDKFIHQAKSLRVQVDNGQVKDILKI